MKRKAEKEMGAPEQDKLWGHLEGGSFSFCFWEELAVCQRCSRRIAEKDGDDEGRNGFVNSVQNPMFGRGGVAGDATTTSRGKYKQAVSAKTGDESTGCSLSSGKEDKKSKSQEAEIKGFESIEWFCKQRGAAGKEGQSGPARKESGLEEDWRVDMDIEGRRSSRMVKTRGSWMSKERGCRRNCETSRSSRSYRRKSIQSGLKAGLQQDIEQKRHDLLREHQRVQKTSQQARVRTHGNLKRTARMGTPEKTARKRSRVPSKETARKRSRVPQVAEATQRKGGALGRSGRKTSGRK